MVPKGEPDNFMTAGEARSKFDDLVSPYLDPARREALATALLTLDQATSVGPMLELTRSEPAALRAAGED